MNGWEGSLKRFSEWLGSEYLAGASKKDAVQYKAHLLKRLQHASCRTELNRLKAFWNYAVDHGEVEINIWNGLTKKLSPSTKKARVTPELLTQARKKADELRDLGFYIQLYSGCRKGCHQGLRWCDIDTTKETIRFEEYDWQHVKRRLKGGTKDERTIPMHSKLKAKILELMPELAERNDAEPIWLKEYSTKEEVFGAWWSKRHSMNYNFTSHELRAHIVTQLLVLNTSPFILHEITRHTVPGMSEVVTGYVRPTMNELRKVIEQLSRQWFHLYSLVNVSTNVLSTDAISTRVDLHKHNRWNFSTSLNGFTSASNRPADGV